MAQAALEQLNQLGTALQRAYSQTGAAGLSRGTDDPLAAALTRIASTSFAGTPLRPTRREQVFQETAIRVQRGQDLPEEHQYRGRDGLAESLLGLARSLADGEGQLQTHFKIVGVRLGSPLKTNVLVQWLVIRDELAVQMDATWQCLWTSGETEQPRLVAISVTDFEQTSVSSPSGRWFADAALSVLGHNREAIEQLAFGHHDWLQRLERITRFDTSVRNGLAVGDANGDGLEDVFICQPPCLPNRLFVQNPDGTATDVSRASGVDFLDQTSSALFCDFDNDGDQDLALGMPVGILILANDGKGRFRLEATLPLDYDVQSLSSADYDQDGRLDLFACVYRTAQPQSGQSFLYRDAVGGGINRLYRNQVRPGEWSFQEVTKETGLLEGADRYSLAASWEDFDNDGDQDLYVANDFGPNCLYENRAGRFVNIAEQSGVTDIGSGMSVSWGDVNRDGWMDLYVGNMFSSAGLRVTEQPDFRPGEDEPIRQIYRRLAKGNSLFLNEGTGHFREMGAQAQVELGRWAWSSLFVDLNNDGWEDLFVANGYMTTEDSSDL